MAGSNLVGRRNYKGRGVVTADDFVIPGGTSLKDIANGGGGNSVSVKKYGAKVNGIADDTDAVQQAINECANNGGGTVTIPAGTCCLRSIYMRENVTIEGASVRGTVLKALPSNEKGLITANYPQPIHRACVRRLTLDGGWINDGQSGLYMDATQQVTAPHTGGVWYSHFELLHINGFKGPSIFSRAINIDGDVANQFLEFRQITAYRWQDPSGCCLKMIGQLGQATFYQCEFSTSAGGQKIAGSNVQIGRDTTATDPTEADQTPMAVAFITCSFQNAAEAVNIRRAANIDFYNCWLENIGKGFTVWESARQVSVNKTHFANACSDGSGGGYGVKATGNSTVAVTANYFFGSIDVPIWDDTAYGIDEHGNRVDGTYTGPLTKGFTKQLNLTGNSLDSWWHRDIMINANNADLTTLNSKLGPNEYLTIRSWNLGKYIRIVSGGNILIRQPLYLKHGEYATFKFSDMPGASGWEMIATSQRELRTNSLDTDATGQFFYLGEPVINTDPVTNAFEGWKCTKQGKYHATGGNVTMTNGSPNVTFNDAVTYKWAAGDAISGTGIPAGTTILTLTGNSAVLSNNCTQNASSVPVSDATFRSYGALI